MAQLVLAAAGAVIGSFAGPFGAQIGWAVGSFLGSSLTRKKSVQEGSVLTDLRVTGTEYGQVIPWVQGHPRIAGQIWWASDRRPIAHYTATGGKGPDEITVVTYTYEVDLMIGLTCNEIVGIARIWDNGKLIYNALSTASDATVTASEESEKWSRFTVYTGAVDQLPDPTYEAAVGAANAPAYIGRSYAFFQSYQLGVSGVIPNLTFEVVTKGTVIALDFGAVSPSASATGSPDGGTWVETGTISPAMDNVRVLDYGNGYFIAGGGGTFGSGNRRIFRSTDRLTWTQVFTDNGVGSINGGVYSPTLGRWLIAGQQNTGMMYSDDDGATWNLYSLATMSRLRDILWSESLSLFLIVGNESNNPSLQPDTFTSSTGLDGSWTMHSAVLPANWWFSSCAWNETGEYFLGLANGGHTATSSNGISWTQHSGAMSLYTWRGLIWVADWGKWFAFAGGGLTIYAWSTDGITWTEDNLPFALSSEIDSHYNGSVLVVVTNGVSNIAVTADGVTWSNENTASGYERVVAGPVDDTLVDPESEALSDVVSRLCTRAGLAASDIDVSGLTDDVHALAVGTITSTRQAIEMLAAAFYFDATVSNEIKFVERGGSSVVTIPYADIGAGLNAPQAEDRQWSLEVANEIEVASQVNVTYPNINFDFNVDTQASDRLITSILHSVEEVQVPVGMTAAEAKGVADSMALDRALSNIRTEIAVLADYAQVEPTDIVTITGPGGETYRMRVLSRLDTYPVLTLELVQDAAEILADSGTTTTDYTESSTVAAPADTVMLLLDIPILRDADDDAGFYWAARGSARPYPGSALMRSTDNIQYEQISTITESATLGTTVDALDNWAGGRVFDEASSVQVNVGYGTLSSSTRAAVLNGGVNAARVGNEIIQFHTATLVSAGVYTLTGLLRGCRGTEWAMTGHAVGEDFVILQTTGLRRIDMNSSQLGVSRYYRGVTFGRDIDTATAESFSNSGVGLKPFAPVHVRGSRNASNDLTIEWTRRSRLSVRMIGALGISVPLGEESLAFEVDIVVPGSPDVVRTIDATDIEADYTAAQQTADGLTPGNAVTARIYQVSATVGRGYVLEGTV